MAKRWTEARLRDECFARGRWHWMPGSYKPAEKWCIKNEAAGRITDWIVEVDAAAFAFKRRQDFDRFRRAFPE